MDHNFILVQFDELTQISCDCQRLSLMDVSVHGFASALAVSDCIDCKPCTMADIAAGEDIRLVCLECDRIMDNCSVRIESDSCILQKIAIDCRLTDRKQNILSFDCDCLIFVIDRRESVVFIIDGYALLEYDTARSAVPDQNFLRAPSVAYCDAFFFCFGNFIACRRHFVCAF